MEFMEWALRVHEKLLERRDQLKREVHFAKQKIESLDVEIPSLEEAITQSFEHTLKEAEG